MTTYHNPSSIYAKESCNMVIEPCYARLFSLGEDDMDKIQECASVFRTLTRTTSYIFHTSLKGKISVIEIDFLESDFHHAVGLQYLADIDIPRNTKKIVDWILDNQITDAYLAHSCFYKGKRNDEKDVEKKD